MQDFKLKTKSDLAHSLLDLIRPLKQFYSPGKAWVKIGNVGVHYGERVARMEGFTRVLWGLGPLWSHMEDLPADIQQEAEEWRQWYLEGIINGSNPEHEEYWGVCYDYDQKIVENAAIVVTILIAREKIWDALTKEQQTNLYNFINQCNSCKMRDNNWRYFRILANKLFQTLGLPYDQARLDEDQLGIIEPSYVADGWYFDGCYSRVDYYVPFAMQFYALIYSKVMKDFEPEYCETLRKRASQFSHDFLYWFANDGNEIGFGRSLTYRFAHCCFFGAMGFAGVDDGADFGVMRRLALRNIETWLARPIYDNAGVLTIGYGYENLFMTELYNSPTSPYWALKSFFMLAMPADDPFWTAEEKDFDYDKQKCFKHGHMIIAHEDNNHVLAYIVGQNNPTSRGRCPEKYEKFVYSNQFSFSIPREPDLVGGSYDNCLVASYAGQENYVMRHGNNGFAVNDDAAKVNYNLFPEVAVKSVIVPCGAWHVRVHQITNSVAIDVADGGFSIEVEPKFEPSPDFANGAFAKEKVQFTENSAFGVFDWGVSGVTSLTGADVQWIECMPNTNLLHNLTSLPMACKTLPAGEHLMITCVFGDRSQTATEKMQEIPTVEVCDGKITVTTKDKTVVESFLD
ncbi:MAG: DUF2264 domain-containing protein [Clostridia bacterium]